MPNKRTAAQLEQDKRRLGTMSKPVEGTDADGVAIVSAPLTVMLGEAETFYVGNTPYTLGLFITRNLRKGFELFQKCPAVLLAQALATKDDEPIDLEQATKIYNEIVGRNGDSEETMPATASEYGSSLASLPNIITDEMVENMYQPLLLALKRHHPDITAEDIADEFDIATFIRSARAIFRINTGLTQSF